MRNRLFVFCGLANDAKGILATVYRFAFVDIKLCLNAVALELSITPFAYADGWRGLLDDPQFALGHVQSLAHLAGQTQTCGNQTAPVPLLGPT